MKITKTLLLVAAVSALAFSSCKKDKEDPSITITSPAEHTEFNGGDVIHVDAVFGDDRDLASYSVEIGDVNGAHIDGFHSDDSGDITGKSYDYHLVIEMPASLTVSVFYVHFSVTDKEGKTTTDKWMLHYAE